MLDKLTQDGNGPPHPAARRSMARPDVGEDTAVATLEPPEEGAAPVEEEVGERWWVPEGATLLEQPKIERPDLSTDARALENLLVSHFDGHDLKMPPLLHIAEQVLKKLRDRKCGMDSVAQEVAGDQVIAASILRMANSPLYRGLHRITALGPAVTRLGAKAISTLMMHESLRAAMFHRKGKGNELARILWERSLAGACVMHGLAKFAQVDEEDAHLMGLLHDIGSVIVLRIVLDGHMSSRYDIDVDTFEYLCLECHQEFGELVADAWALPSDLKSLIASHHTYPEPDDPLRTARLLLQLTDMINAMLGFGSPRRYDLLNSRVVDDLGLKGRADFVAFLKDLPDQIEQTVEWL